MTTHRNCELNRGYGMRAHFAPHGATWSCSCGKTWRVTQNHVGPFCGCGWERIA